MFGRRQEVLQNTDNAVANLLVYINGGHEPLFVLNEKGVKETLRPTGPAVGLFAQTEFVYKKLTLQPGNILFGLRTVCLMPDPIRARGLLKSV
ncbi:MAG: serine/threonine-protein phosphatase [Deltaproteobacteria bacterium]|nr:serine/threonine-protein phosphatase [Deltaproteobacteria bacterium]